MKQTKIWILMLLVMSILFTNGCKIQTPSDKTPSSVITEFETTQELKKFSSSQELRDFLLKNAVDAATATSYSGLGPSSGGIRTASLDKAVMESAAPAAKSAEASGAPADSYSTTNIQVEGVDEADFVKNDGKYIYVISQNKLVIVDAFPAEDAEILSETKIDGTPRNMFVNEDRLVVFSDDNDEVPVIAEYDYIPRPRYTQMTHIFVYDISDREKPKVVKDYNLNGYYFESRMIGDYVYFIVQENSYYYGPLIDLPVIRQASSVVARPEVYYFDNPEFNYNFNTVGSISIFENHDKVNAKTFMMGYTNNIYVSQNNVYITYQKNLPYIYYEKHNEERFFDVVVPLLPSEFQNRINVIKDDGSLDSREKWDRISAILEEMYNKLEENEKEALIEEIDDAVSDYEARIQAERSKTVIHKIKIDNGNIEYGTRGEVPGYLLNQFSMDENNGYFRVGTTTDIWTTRESVMYNNVYVLDDNLEIAGKLEAIAPDERIYSTRFIGDRLYMVTFKRIDPLFVIDLSNPEEPEILGELKIPGFSDYLHPYDENYIIGIGKETEGNEWGGVSVKGVKLALFDVSDVKNPKPSDTYEIGKSGTDSEALRDHKAFLFDKEKNLIVIPVTEVKDKPYYDSKVGYYRQRYWQGAYVFSLTPANGFDVKGKITHNEGDEDQNYYWYGSPNAVRRALYMDDVLYTVSGIKIKANDLSDISKEIKEIKLPYEKEDYPYPVYRGGVETVAIE